MIRKGRKEKSREGKWICVGEMRTRMKTKRIQKKGEDGKIRQ